MAKSTPAKSKVPYKKGKVGKSEVKPETKASGKIEVDVYKTKPHEVSFSGNINGRDLLQAIKYLRKGYRKWKGEVYRKQEKGGK